MNKDSVPEVQVKSLSTCTLVSCFLEYNLNKKLVVYQNVLQPINFNLSASYHNFFFKI